MVPCVMKKVSSCISCQWGGGPGVFGGRMSSATPRRLSDGIVSHCELRSSSSWTQTCARAIFHHSTSHWTQLEGLALLDGHEIDGDIGNRYYACHGCCREHKIWKGESKKWRPPMCDISNWELDVVGMGFR